MAITVEDTKAMTTKHAFAAGWVKHYGWPEMVVCDQGPEFLGRDFSRY